MKKNILPIFLLILGALSINVFAQKTSKSDTPVTSIIHDSDPFTGLDYRMKSDGAGPYKNQVDSVVSIIQGIGDWELDGKGSTVRKVFFDFRDPAVSGDPNNVPNPPFQTALTPWRFISKCAQRGIKMQDLQLNQPVLCPLAMSIDYGGATYAVRFNPTNYPETEWVQWTCLSVNSSGKCNGWEMVPSLVQLDGERKVKGQLLKISFVKGKMVEEARGLFYFSFRVNLTNP